MASALGVEVEERVAASGAAAAQAGPAGASGGGRGGRRAAGGRGGSAGPAPARAQGTKAPARPWRGPPPAAPAPRDPQTGPGRGRGAQWRRERAPLAVNELVPPSRRASSSRCPGWPRHARQPRAGPSVSRTRTGGRSAHCPAQAPPQPFPQPRSPRGVREKRRGCRAPPSPPAKPGYLGGLPGGGSQPGQAGPPHTRGGGSGGGGCGGGSSARPPREGRGRSSLRIGRRALMDSRPVPPLPFGRAGLALRPLLRRPDSRLSCPSGQCDLRWTRHSKKPPDLSLPWRAFTSVAPGGLHLCFSSATARPTSRSASARPSCKRAFRSFGFRGLSPRVFLLRLRPLPLGPRSFSFWAGS
ncbi:translation initiation factor IF-2-like [Mustela putorius furo]|uniref:Translation initiation factor IF-2-like n=1 Tax=Mustela putorius furo TaxID=9669 RepID=A0A8U0SF73_MUSPF|nr:translation initiation factor IF-2-like [Mustela putorius furo]